MSCDLWPLKYSSIRLLLPFPPQLKPAKGHGPTPLASEPASKVFAKQFGVQFTFLLRSFRRSSRCETRRNLGFTRSEKGGRLVYSRMLNGHNLCMLAAQQESDGFSHCPDASKHCSSSFPALHPIQGFKFSIYLPKTSFCSAPLAAAFLIARAEIGEWSEVHELEGGRALGDIDTTRVAAKTSTTG